MSESSDLSSETSPADTGELTTSPDCAAAAKKVRDFPQTAGVYLMKDAAGRVIYVGKAKNLRSRAGSYFLKAAEVDRRTADLVREIRDIDYIEADSEVDALLLELHRCKRVTRTHSVCSSHCRNALCSRGEGRRTTPPWCLL